MQLSNVISKKDIYFLYQPIYNLVTNELIGAEALMRGPDGQPPGFIFEEAKKLGFCRELDYLCLLKCMESAPPIPRLFVNVYPSTVLWLVKNKMVKELMKMYPPDMVTLELIEMENVRGYISELADAVSELKKSGYSVAVDDISSGFERLLLVSLLKPEYIKLDRPLIKNLGSRINQVIIKNLSNMARELNAIFIAEGIETKDELERVMELGVQFGQGFLLGKPS